MTDFEAHTGFVIVVIVAVITGIVGMQIIGAVTDFQTQEELDDTRAHFEDYCTAEYGDDATVYLTNDAYMAEHNGFHCDYGGGVVHLNQVPSDVWENYKTGEIPASEVTANLEKPPGLLPLPDRGTFSRAIVIAGLVSAVLYVVARFRASEENDDD